MEEFYYSQHGEDFLLWTLLKEEVDTGYFVEVGCLDGIRFSNTYFFEKQGWSGACVEPHPDYFPLLTANRPKSDCIEVAAGSSVGSIDLFAEPRGDFSTIVQEVAEDQRLREKMAGYRKVSVPMQPLNQILQKISAPSPIDIVSIDVEGAEFAVLDGFDLEFYRPRVLVIEANGSAFNHKLDCYMRQRRYVKAGRLASNNFYCRQRRDAIRLSLIDLTCTVVLPPHPLHPRAGVDDRETRQQIRQGRLLFRHLERLSKRAIRRAEHFCGR